MKFKNFKHTLAFIVCLAVICSMFSACSKKNESVKTDDDLVHTAHWAVSPSIEAEAIEPFARADFNETTNHYDISFADCFRIKQNGKYGIIDLTGKIVVEPEYDELFAIRNSRDFLGVQIDSDGERWQTYVNYPSFELEDAYNEYNSEKYEYYWNTGLSKPIFVKIYDEESETDEYKSEVPETLKGVTETSDGEYKEDGTYGLYSMNRNVSGMVYSGAGQFSDGKAAFKSGNKWGYIDSNGRTVIPFEYDAVPGYSALGGEDTPYESYHGYLTLCKDGKYGIQKSDGTIVAPFSYDGATPVVKGAAFVCIEGKWGVLIVDSDSAAAVDITATEKVSSEDASEEEDAYETEAVEDEYYEDTEENEENSVEDTDENEEDSDYNSGYYRVDRYANLRGDAGMGDNVLGTVAEGDTVYVDDIDGAWGHVTYNGQEGWFYLGYAEKE